MTTTYRRWLVSRSTLPYAEWAELHPREDRAPERSVAIAWVLTINESGDEGSLGSDLDPGLPDLEDEVTVHLIELLARRHTGPGYLVRAGRYWAWTWMEPATRTAPRQRTTAPALTRTEALCGALYMPKETP